MSMDVVGEECDIDPFDGEDERTKHPDFRRRLNAYAQSFLKERNLQGLVFCVKIVAKRRRCGPVESEAGTVDNSSGWRAALVQAFVVASRCT